MSRTPLALCASTLILAACGSPDIRLAAQRYALVKQHFLLREWTIVCEQPRSVSFIAEGPKLKQRFIGGTVLERGEHVLWVQWDFNSTGLLMYHLPPTTTMASENILGGSFAVVEPEGCITRTGRIQLLESYDKKSAVYVNIEPPPHDQLKN